MVKQHKKSILLDKALKIFGGGGDDNLVGSDVSETMAGGAGDDLIMGGGGPDLIDGDEGDDFLYGECGNDLLAGGAGDDVVIGGADEDTLRGDSGEDFLTGNQGIDLFYVDAEDIADAAQAGDDDDVLIAQIGTHLLLDDNDTALEIGTQDLETAREWLQAHARIQSEWPEPVVWDFAALGASTTGAALLTDLGDLLTESNRGCG